MKRRLLCIILTLAMVLPMLPGTARAADTVAKIGNETYDTLQEAIDAAKDGDTVILQQDITSNASITITKKITIDFGKDKTVTFPGSSDGFGFRVAADVTFQNGTIAANNLTAAVLINKPDATLDVSLKNMVIHSNVSGAAVMPLSGIINLTVEDSEIANTIASGTAAGERRAAIECWSSSPVTVKVFGESKVTNTGTSSAINGAYTAGKIDIEIAGNALISSTEGAGILQMADGTVTVNGGTVSGHTSGITMTKGKLLIKGGTITADGQNIGGSSAENHVGDNGAAVYVEPSGAVDVTISGGKLTSTHSYAVSAPKSGSTFKITDGIFTGGEGAINVGTGPTGFIFGGTFRKGSDPDTSVSSYLAAGLEIKDGSVSHSSGFLSGSGKDENDPYKIYSLTDLESFRDYVNAGKGDGEYFQLMANIDMSAAYNVSKSWTPIGDSNSHSFMGTFDGGSKDGHQITGLYINASENSNSEAAYGLFGYVGEKGTVQNVEVADESITVEAKGAATMSNVCAGGVAGSNSGTVKDCKNTGKVKGITDTGDIRHISVGGVVGENSGTVTNCYNIGNVESTDSNTTRVGGVAGYSEKGTVTNCYNTGAVKSGGDAGGVVGYSEKGTVTNCYYLSGKATGGINGKDTVGAAESKTDDEFASGEVAWLLQNGQDAPEPLVWGQTIRTDHFPLLVSSKIGENALKVYKVTFVNNSGEVAAEYANQGGKVSRPTLPAGITVNQWYAKDSTDPWDFDTDTVSADITLFAEGMTGTTYTITIDDKIEKDKGSVTADKAEAAEGETVTLTVTPKEGYKLSALTYTYTDKDGKSVVKTLDKNGAYTFTMPASDVTVSAVFEAIQYKITVNQPVDGDVQADKAKAAKDVEVTLTVTPDEGYELESLTVTYKDENDEPVSVPTTGSGTTYTFTMPASDVTVTVKFKAIQYKITVNQPVDGNVTADKDKAAKDVEVTLTVKPNEGFKLDTLSVTDKDGESVAYTSTGNDEYTFKMPASDVTVTAEFMQANLYRISISEMTHGEITTANLKVAADQPVILTVTPEPGYQLIESSLIVTNSDSKEEVTVDKTQTDGEYVFTMPAGDVTVKARFEQRQYSVSASQGVKNGRITIDVNSELVTPGQVTVKILVEPDEGYQLKSMTVTAVADSRNIDINKTVQGNSAYYISFTMPSSNVEIWAEFEPIPGHDYKITVDTAITNGTVTTNKDVSKTAKAGETVKVTVTPDTGYRLKTDSLTYTDKNEKSVVVTARDADGNYTFTMPASNVTVKAEFEKVYAIKVDEAENGAVTTGNDPDRTAIKGEQVTLTVTPDEGYKLKEGSLTVTSESGTRVDVTAGKDGKYTFEMPAGNVTVSAEFELINYQIKVTVKQPGNGHITVAVNPDRGDEVAAKGDEVKLTVTPDEGYQLKEGSLVCTDESGKSVALTDNKDGTYTFAMPASDVTVSAEFELIKYEVEVTQLENGTVTADPTSAAEGDEVKLTVKAKTGYGLKSLTVLNKNTKETFTPTDTGNDTYTFTMPASDVTVSAVFEKVYTVTINTSPAAGGNVNAPTSAAEGDTVTVEVNAKPGYELKSLTYTYTGTDGKPVVVTLGEDDAYTFTMPASNVTVTAVFSLIPTLTLTPAELKRYVGETADLRLTVTPADTAIDNDDIIWDTDESIAAFVGDPSGMTATIKAIGEGECNVTASVFIDGKEYTAVCKVTVVYTDKKTHNITVKIDGSAGKVGSITSNYTSAIAGSEIRLTAGPVDGYELTLTCTDSDGNPLDVVFTWFGKNVCTFDMPDCDVIITAKFNPINDYKYPVTVLDLTDGKITAKPTEAHAGTEVVLTVTPDTDFQLQKESLTVTNVNTGKAVDVTAGKDGKTYVFTMPASEVTVSAVFEEREYTVAVSEKLKNGEILIDESSKVAYHYDDETLVKVRLVPHDGYEYTKGNSGLTVTAVDGKNVKIDDVHTVKVNEEYYISFKMPKSDVVISAEFTPLSGYEYSITVSKPTNGSVTADKEKAAAGDKVTLTVTPNTGYTLDKLTVTDENDKTVTVSGKDGTYTFTMPASNVTVSAKFAESTATPEPPGGGTSGGSKPSTPTYLIIVHSSAGGSVTGGGVYEKGKTVTVRAYPASGYTFACWLENGVIASSSEIYPPFIASADRVLTAVFVPMNSGSSGSSGSSGDSVYRVIAPVVSNGSVTVTPRSAKAGDTVTVIAMPDSGYATAGVSAVNRSGGSVPVRDTGDNVYTFTMPSSQVTVDLTFSAVSTPAPSAGAPGRTPGRTPSTPSVSTVNSFTDVPAEYATAVAWAIGRGITAGTGDGTFSPNDPCTRSQILTFIWRAEGMPDPVSPNPFSDVKPDDYYYKASAWAYEQGMVNGRTFDADMPCTRGEAMTYLWQLEWQMGPPASSSTATAFTDVPAFGYASQAIPWAVAKGITNGTSATTFSPEAVCTRGQIMTFLYRYNMS